MSDYNNLCIICFILPTILCHVDQNFIKKQNGHVKEFFFICIILIVIGFVIGPIFLIIILPLIVDENDEESINSSNKSHRNRRNSKTDSDDSQSLTGDEEEDFYEQDIEEIASF